MTADTPGKVDLHFSRMPRGGWLVQVSWVRPGGSKQRSTVFEVPDGMIFDAIESASRMLKSDAFGKRNNAEELFPPSFR
jgi:hypothetical protein